MSLVDYSVDRTRIEIAAAAAAEILPAFFFHQSRSFNLVKN